MFKANTLFVVGAGASHEFGLPVGLGLSEIIKQNSILEFGPFNEIEKGNHALFASLKKKYPNTDQESTDKLNERIKAVRRIHDGIYLASSIDNFIDMHSHDPHIAEMGKLQIAFSISNAERNSSLFRCECCKS